MADTAVIDGAEGDLPALPGELTIADRVGSKIAERAALGVDDVVPYASATGKLPAHGAVRSVLGGAYPLAQIDMAASAPRLSVQVALTWPSRITDVCQRLRTHLADELERLTGVRPAAVDVSVAKLVPRAQVRQVAPGLVELPSAVAADRDAAERDAAEPVAEDTRA